MRVFRAETLRSFSWIAIIDLSLVFTADKVTLGEKHMNINDKLKRAAALAAAAVIMTSLSSCKRAEIEQASDSDKAETTDEVVFDLTSSSDSYSLVSSSASSKAPKTVVYVTGVSRADVYGSVEELSSTGTLAAGSPVELISEDSGSGYTRIKSGEGLEGFVKSIYLVADKDSVTSGATVSVSGEGTKVFEKPGGEGSVVETLYDGEEVTLLAKTSGGYWRVLTSIGNSGYVSVTSFNANTISQTESQAAFQPDGSSGTANTTTYIYYDGGTPAAISSSSAASDRDDTLSSASSLSMETKPVTTDPDSSLSAAVSAAQSSVGGTWSGTYIDLITGQSSSYNSAPMQSASLIKLFIMGAVYEKYDTYSAIEPNIDSWLYSMITVSDNTCANNLVNMLGSGNNEAGMSAVTSYCRQHGYSGTSMGRLLLAPAINGDNYTTTADCANFLASAYNGELPHSADMMNLLSQQTVTYKIPAGVPVRTANKTGELESVQNDAAVVYADRPYVLCVMSENVPSGAAISAIVDISSSMYSSVDQ